MALVTRFINAASTGGDGTTAGLTGATAAYATIAGWDTGELTNLITDGDVHDLTGGGGLLTEQADFAAGWTTDVTNYVRFTVAEASRHDGTPGTGFRISSSSAFNGTLALDAEGTILDFLEIINTSGSPQAQGVFIDEPDCIIQGCIIEGGSSSSSHGIRSNEGDGMFLNNLIHDCGDNGIDLPNFNAGTLYNNTLVDNGGDGVFRTGGGGTAPKAINNVAFNNTGNDFDSPSVGWLTGTTTNASEDGTAPGTSPQTGVASADFTDASSNDFSIADTDSILYQNGTDIETELGGFDRTDYPVPIADIISVERPQATDWDISAWEFLAGATTFFQTNTGSLTATGAIEKQVNKELAGSTTATGALTRLIQKIVDGSATASGDVATQTVVQQAVSGSATAAGALTRQINKIVAGSATPTGTVQKQINKILVGTLTPSGALQKRIEKVLDGSLTPTGTVATTVVILLQLTGQVIATGALATLFIPASIVDRAARKLINVVLRPILRSILRDPDD